MAVFGGWDEFDCVCRVDSLSGQPVSQGSHRYDVCHPSVRCENTLQHDRPRDLMAARFLGILGLRLLEYANLGCYIPTGICLGAQVSVGSEYTQEFSAVMPLVLLLSRRVRT